MSDHPRTHNLPSIADALDPAVVRSWIDDALDALRPRANELIGMCQRFTAAHPEITTAEQDAKAAECLAVVQRFCSVKGRVETARVALKEPIQAATVAIGSMQKGPFANLLGTVYKASASIERASIAFKQKVDAETRRKAQEEADRKAEEARTTERLAKSGSSMVTLDDAATAYEASAKARQTANAKTADLTRAHGDDAGATSLRYRRVVTITAPADVPRAYCSPDLALIQRAAGKAGTPIPDIDGVKIEDVPDLTIRR
jgi:hypothetical protein